MMTHTQRTCLVSVPFSVLLFIGLNAYAQQPEAWQEILQKNLPAVAHFEQGQPSGALEEIERLVFRLPADSPSRTAIEEQLLAALQTAQTHDAKDFLCRQLHVLGTAKCVPVVAQLLTDPDDSAGAIYALERLEVPAVDDFLLKALDAATGATQAGIIHALANRGAHQATPRLRQLLSSTDNEAVRRACARALGRIGGEDAVPTLLSAAKSAKGELAKEIQNALLQSAEDQMAAGKQQQAAEIYAQLQQLPTSTGMHLATLRGRILAQRESAAQLLVSEILNADAAMARNAIALIPLVPGAQATTSFANLLDQLPADNQVLLLRALGKRGDTAATPALVAAVGSTSDAVRLAALEALGDAGNADALEVLLTAAAGSGEPALVARRSLLLLKDASTDAKLTALLSPENRLAVEASRAVAGRGYSAAVPALLQLAASTEETVRRVAIESLGELTSTKDLPAVTKLLVDASSSADQAILTDAIAKLLTRIDNEQQRTTPLLTALQSAPDSAKPALVVLLGRTHSDAALKTIRGAMQDGNAAMQQAAARALAQWPDARVIEDLLRIIRTSSDADQKELALQGYMRLGSLSENPTAMFRAILRQVDRDSDKKLILEGLGLTADSPATFDLTRAYLSERELAPTAGLATLRIAHRLRDSHADVARQALKEVLAKVDHADVRSRAQEVLNDMDRFADHILQWVGAGPYTEKGKDGRAIYDIPFAPEKPEAADVQWQPIDKGLGSWDINLEAMFGGYDHCAAYLKTRVWSPKAQEASLEFGCDDAVKAWLNDQLVFEQWTEHGASPRQHRADIKLREGWNTLMLKVVDLAGGWVVGARVRAPDGTELEGLKISAE